MKSIKTILYVENDPVSLTMYQNRLQREGFHVETAQDGLVALRFLSQFTPDLVVLDLMLPRFNGAEVFKIMRTDRRLRNVPVVIFSNAAVTEWPQDIAVGLTQCLPKTESTFPMLLQAIQDLLASAPMQEASPPKTTPTPAVVKPETNGTPSPAPVSPPAPASSTLSPSTFVNVTPAKGRTAFVREALAEIPKLRESCLAYIKAPAAETSQHHLSTLHLRIQYFNQNAGPNGCARVALLANSFGALLSEIAAKPSWATPSVLQTMAQAMDCLRLLLNQDKVDQTQQPLKVRVLAVDDDAVCNHVMSTTLKRANFEPTTIENSLSALELLRTSQFDLVLLDVNMPDLNGFEMCTKLRRLPHCKTTPVIFVTAFNNFDNRKQSVLSGGNDFITKPISPLELALKVTIHLLKAQVQRPNTPSVEPEPDIAGVLNPPAASVFSQPANRVTPSALPASGSFPLTDSRAGNGETVSPFAAAFASSPANLSPATAPNRGFQPAAAAATTPIEEPVVEPHAPGATPPSTELPTSDAESYRAAEVAPLAPAEPIPSNIPPDFFQTGNVVQTAQSESNELENMVATSFAAPATESPVNEAERIDASEMAPLPPTEPCPAQSLDETFQRADSIPAAPFEQPPAEEATPAEWSPAATESYAGQVEQSDASQMVPPPPTEPCPANVSEVSQEPAASEPVAQPAQSESGSQTFADVFQRASEPHPTEVEKASASDVAPPPPTEPCPANVSHVSDEPAAAAPAAQFEESKLASQVFPEIFQRAAEPRPAEVEKASSPDVAPPPPAEPCPANVSEASSEPWAATPTAPIERAAAESLPPANEYQPVSQPSSSNAESTSVSNMPPPPTEPCPANYSETSQSPTAFSSDKQFEPSETIDAQSSPVSSAAATPGISDVEQFKPSETVAVVPEESRSAIVSETPAQPAAAASIAEFKQPEAESVAPSSSPVTSSSPAPAMESGSNEEQHTPFSPATPQTSAEPVSATVSEIQSQQAPMTPTPVFEESKPNYVASSDSSSTGAPALTEASGARDVQPFNTTETAPQTPTESVPANVWEAQPQTPASTSTPPVEEAKAEPASTSSLSTPIASEPVTQSSTSEAQPITLSEAAPQTSVESAPANVSESQPQPAASTSVSQFEESKAEPASTSNLSTPTASEPTIQPGTSEAQPTTISEAAPQTSVESAPANVSESQPQSAASTSVSQFEESKAEPASTSSLSTPIASEPVTQSGTSEAQPTTISEAAPQTYVESAPANVSESQPQPAALTSASQFEEPKAEPASTSSLSTPTASEPTTQSGTSEAQPITVSEVAPQTYVESAPANVSDSQPQPVASTPASQFEESKAEPASTSSLSTPTASEPTTQFGTSEVQPITVSEAAPQTYVESAPANVSEFQPQPVASTPASQFEESKAEPASTSSLSTPTASEATTQSGTSEAQPTTISEAAPQSSSTTDSEAQFQPANSATSTPAAPVQDATAEPTTSAQTSGAATENTVSSTGQFATAESSNTGAEANTPSTTTAVTNTESSPAAFSDHTLSPATSETQPAVHSTPPTEAISTPESVKTETEGAAASSVLQPASEVRAAEVEPVSAANAAPATVEPSPATVSQATSEPAVPAQTGPTETLATPSDVPASALTSATDTGTSDAHSADSSNAATPESVGSPEVQSAVNSTPTTEAHTPITSSGDSPTATGSSDAAFAETSDAATPTTESNPADAWKDNGQPVVSSEAAQPEVVEIQSPSSSDPFVAVSESTDNSPAAAETFSRPAVATVDDRQTTAISNPVDQSGNRQMQAPLTPRASESVTETGTSDPGNVESSATAATAPFAAEPATRDVRELAPVHAGPQSFASAAQPQASPAANRAVQNDLLSGKEAYDQIALQVARIIFGENGLTEVRIRLVRFALERHTVHEILHG